MISTIGLGVLLLVTIFLLAEHAVDINGVMGGNEQMRTIALPATGGQVPLPNPAVYQDEVTPPLTRSMQIAIPAGSQIDVKVKMEGGKVILYTWQADKGAVYVDYYGQDPALGNDFWVRYEELQEGSSSSGSLTAPFAGEHGWYWLNYNEFDVTITLTVSGYFDDIVNYGLSFY
ncbi:MAG: hypothetical protein V4628_05195 [Pseudomonadota bacterium]